MTILDILISHVHKDMNVLKLYVNPMQALFNFDLHTKAENVA